TDPQSGTESTKGPVVLYKNPSLKEEEIRWANGYSGRLDTLLINLTSDALKLTYVNWETEFARNFEYAYTYSTLFVRGIYDSNNIPILDTSNWYGHSTWRTRDFYGYASGNVTINGNTITVKNGANEYTL